MAYAILCVISGEYLYCYDEEGRTTVDGVGLYLFSETETTGLSNNCKFKLAKFSTQKSAHDRFTRSFWNLNNSGGGSWVIINNESICLFDENYSNYFEIVEVD